MNEWNIQSRSRVCQACERAFADKQPYHTVLIEEKQQYQRLDICPACWESQYREGASERKGFISQWQGIYHAPPAAPVEAIQKESAESLLRKLIEANDPKHGPVCYILAVMLERKRILKVKEQIKGENGRVFIYEHAGTGDVFTVADPNLQLDQLQEVQHDTAQLLAHGLNPPPASPATGEPAPMESVSNGAASVAPDGQGAMDERRDAAATLTSLGTRLRKAWAQIRKETMAPDFNILQTEIQYQFRDPALLRMALTHPSVAHEQGRLVQHNQRLEFLGDAVLGLVLTRELYEKFPNVSEGPLTKARAQMINRRTLAEQARQIALQDHLILSRGEEANLGRSRASAAADAFEALIGAVFIDGGFEAARGFVLRSFHRAFGELTAIPTLDNPKGELQEILQAKSPEAPEYQMVRATGPDHDRDFECVVSHGGIELGRGLGKSKKAAESEAAIAALKKLRGGGEAKEA